MAHHRFQRRVGVLGARHLHHFHLVELVLADHPARVTTIRARLGAEARRMRRQPQRQCLARQDLARHQVRQRHLTGRNQVHRGRHRLTRRLLPGLRPGRRSLVTQLLHPEQVFLELGQLPGAEQCGSVHQIRRVALGIAVPRGVHVQHELGQCPVQACHATAHHGEPCTRELGPSGRVQPQRLAHVQVVLHREVEGGRRAPAAHLHIVGLAAAHWYRLVRQVGQAGQQRIQRCLHRLQLGRNAGLLLRHGVDLGQQRAGILTLALGLANLLGQCIALRLQRLGTRLQRLATGLQGLVAGAVKDEPTGLETTFHLCGVSAQCLNIDHPAILVACRPIQALPLPLCCAQRIIFTKERHAGA